MKLIKKTYQEIHWEGWVSLMPTTKRTENTLLPSHLYFPSPLCSPAAPTTPSLGQVTNITEHRGALISEWAVFSFLIINMSEWQKAIAVTSGWSQVLFCTCCLKRASFWILKVLIVTSFSHDLRTNDAHVEFFSSISGVTGFILTFKINK